MTRYADWPRGLCECHGLGCQCDQVRGPAAFALKRNGVPMKVCTRCDLSSDTDKVLLVTGKEDAMTLQEYDALGMMCILLRLSEEALS